MEYLIADFLKPGMRDSQAVRAALYASRGDNSRTLIFRGRSFVLDEAVELPSDTTVIIDDCTVKQADYTFDNVFRGANYRIDPGSPFDYVQLGQPLRNIRILGRGKAVIAGCDKNITIYHPALGEVWEGIGDFFGWRTHLLHFADLDGLEFSGFRIERARGWAIVLGMSRNGHIHDIEFDTRVKNGDGIDLRHGCRHMVLENFTGYTSDDTVALAGCAAEVTTPARQYLYTGTPWFKELLKRPPEARDMFDIKIRNVRTAGFYHSVIMLCFGGAQMYDIEISDVTDAGQRNCSMVDLYTGYGFAESYRPGDIHDVRIRNIDGNCDNRGDEVKAALAIELPVSSVTASNVTNRGNGKACLITHPEGVTIQP